MERSIPDREPSPPSPHGAEHQPEPIDDGEPFPAKINEPPQSRATEPTTVPTTREQAVDGVSEWSSVPCTSAEGELMIHLGMLDIEGAPGSSARSSKMPGLPPALTSSTVVIWQPPRSPSAPYLYGVSPTGLPSSSFTRAGVSLTSASSLRGPDSASARRPSGSTSAPSSLTSTFTRLSISYTRLPRPSGSALVGR